jgi:arginyl-tRNA synthetase
MNVYEHLRRQVLAVLDALAGDGKLPPGADAARIVVEPPREAAHGDVTTNAAMVLGKSAGMKPKELAGLLADRLAALAEVANVEVAGPGFINMRLKDDFWRARLAEILLEGRAYGDSDLGRAEPVNIEFVSTNPTGPLHVGHGRGAVVGDALARLLEKTGFRVTREFYINDAGAQVEALARSLHVRYREALGETVGPMPEGLYPGDYLVPVARALAGRDGDRWSGKAETEWLEPFRAAAVDAMMGLIRKDLDALGVHFDVFASERRLVAEGKVEAALAFLAERDLVYTGVLEPPKGRVPEDWEPRPQTLFRASRFGDDVDRPLKKSDGSYTYFATDIAYHLDKFRRGFRTMIDVWGADHGGYVRRMQAAVKAVTEGEGSLDVKLCQLVSLLEGGEPVRMSKRTGAFVTLGEVVERVGRDVVRFIMLTRKNDAPLDFDLERVSEQSKDNPVFYVQYAHARARSVMRHAAELFAAGELAPQALAQAPLARLTDGGEIDLIRRMAGWPRLVEGAAEAHEPHRVAFYLNELAAAFHVLWNRGKEDARLRFIDAEDRARTLARLALVEGVASVIRSGLAIFGVTPVEEMR